MILRFRKSIAFRPVFRLAPFTGIIACLLMGGAGRSALAQVATRTQLTAQQNSGDTLSLTATVGGVMGESVSEGSVSFETAKGSLGSVFVHDGTATLNLKNPPQWAKNVTAVYHGDTAFANSTASTDVSAIDAAAATGVPGFTVTASPSSLTLVPGQAGTVNLTLTSQNGFSEAVNLSCSGAPGQVTCSFNPVVATPPANGTTLSAMGITTTATSGVTSSEHGPLNGSGARYALVIPGVLALAGIGAIRRRNLGALRVVGLALLLGAGVLGLSACNVRYDYLHYKPAPNFGTAPGNYTIVVAAYSTNGTAITNATSSDPNCSGAVCVALTVQ